VDVAGEEITLTIANAGAIAVNASGCTISAVSPSARQRLIALGNDWAWGQWLGFNGTFAFHGATLARDGFGLMLIGAPRAGTSLTALALCNRGWALVADGTCPLTLNDSSASTDSRHTMLPSVVAVPGRPQLEVDAVVTTSFPPTSGFRDAHPPRPRSLIPVATSPATPIQLILELVPTTLRSDAVIVDVEPDQPTPALRLMQACVLGQAIQSASGLGERLQQFSVMTTDVVPLQVALLPAGPTLYRPIDIAELIEAHLQMCAQ